jgi:hypothetical protein
VEAKVNSGRRPIPAVAKMPAPRNFLLEKEELLIVIFRFLKK